MTDLCRSCAAPIVWARTNRGKMMPIDPAPRSDGNLVYIGVGVVEVVTGERLPLEERYVAHFVTCPQAGKWRR
jgi:hypothetical protein